MKNKFSTYYNSPIGMLKIAGTQNAITELSFMDIEETIEDEIPEYLKKAVTQLDEYFSGKRKEFDLNLEPEGTDFQIKVWEELMQIPFGKTVSYLQIAESLGDKKTIRAVGNANGKNKIAIIIPCHRVIGSHGELTGYAGGAWRKDWLLKHERKFSSEPGQLNLEF